MLRACCGNFKHLKPTSRDMWLDQIWRHLAPAKACKQEVEAAGQVDKPPDATTDDPVARTIRVEGVGQHQLHMGFKVILIERALELSQGVVCRNDGDQLPVHQRISHQVVRYGRQ